MNEVKRALNDLAAAEAKWESASPEMKAYYERAIKEQKALVKKLAKEFPEKAKHLARTHFKAV